MGLFGRDERLLRMMWHNINEMTPCERRAYEVLRYLAQIRSIRAVRDPPGTLEQEEAAALFSRLMLPELQWTLLVALREVHERLVFASARMDFPKFDQTWS